MSTPWATLWVKLEELAKLQQLQQVKAEDITLRVVDPDDRIVKHRMRTTDKLQGVMDEYYAAASDVCYGTGNFVFEGVVLRPTKTPADYLDLEDGAQIDFFPYSSGGGWESDDS